MSTQLLFSFDRSLEDEYIEAAMDEAQNVAEISGTCCEHLKEVLSNRDTCAGIVVEITILVIGAIALILDTIEVFITTSRNDLHYEALGSGLDPYWYAILAVSLVAYCTRVGVFIYEVKSGTRIKGCCKSFLRVFHLIGTIVFKDCLYSMLVYLSVGLDLATASKFQQVLDIAAVFVSGSSCLFRYLYDSCFEVYVYLAKHNINCFTCCTKKAGGFGIGYVLGMGWLTNLHAIALGFIWFRFEIVVAGLFDTNNIITFFNDSVSTNYSSTSTPFQNQTSCTESCKPSFEFAPEEDFIAMAFVLAFWLGFWIIALCTSCCCCCCSCVNRVESSSTYVRHAARE